MFNKQQILDEVKKYFNGDDLAANVWIDKYSLKDKNENVLEKTPDDMHKRLAKEFARIEKKYKNPISEEEIYNLFKDFKYLIPQGRPMAGIGNDYQIQSISNCFLIPSVSDSYGSIMLADQRMAQIFKRGGGVGVNISNLRPSGSPTSNSAVGISGATTYMDRFSYTTGEVSQNQRRGKQKSASKLCEPIKIGCLRDKANGGNYLIAKLNNNTVLSICYLSFKF